MDARAIQFEKHWRNQISEEILQYDLDTHQCYGDGCTRCDISAALKVAARRIRHGNNGAEV